MGENSKIEWCHHTFNPWTGCQKISPGCDHCYAEGWAKRSGIVEWGPHGVRRRTSPANWKQPLKWEKAAKAAGVRPRVFCASLADWLDNQVENGWREDLADVIDQTPNLDWLLLTKRPENFHRCSPWLKSDMPPNVWFGVTAENQEQADRRGRLLREIEARVRFFSCEPMLGPIKIELETIQALDWVICGGESGPGARPTHPDWARSLRDQCETAGVHFHFKQWGEWAPNVGAVDGWTLDDNPEISRFDHREWEDGRWSDPFRPMWCDFSDGNYDEEQCVSRVGKKRAGRILDGVEHNGFPA